MLSKIPKIHRDNDKLNRCYAPSFIALIKKILPSVGIKLDESDEKTTRVIFVVGNSTTSFRQVCQNQEWFDFGLCCFHFVLQMTNMNLTLPCNLETGRVPEARLKGGPSNSGLFSRGILYWTYRVMLLVATVVVFVNPVMSP